LDECIDIKIGIEKSIVEERRYVRKVANVKSCLEGGEAIRCDDCSVFAVHLFLSMREKTAGECFLWGVSGVAVINV
jgi:hypothetical protein